MNCRKVMTLTAVFAAILVASTAFAGPGGWFGCCGGGRSAGLWSDLDENQRKEITSLETEFYKKQEAIRSEIAKKSIELREMAGKDNPDEAALQKKREEIWALQDAMRDEGRAYAAKVRSMLTPDQRKKMGPFGPGLGSRCGQGPGKGGGFCSGCPFAAQGSGSVL